MSVEPEILEKIKNQSPKEGGNLSLGSIVLLAGIVISAAIFGLALMRQSETQPGEGTPASDFEFTTFDGETYRLSDFRGKVVMLNFWASWCAPCREEAPELQAAWEYYQDKDVVFLGIAYADNGPKSLEYLEEFDVTYLNAPDLGTRISEEYNIQGVPETFIIDKEGNVAQFIYAGVTRERLISIIDGLLQ